MACFLSLALADTQDFRRLGRQVQDRPQQQPQRRLRPVPKRRLPGPPPVPAGSASASEPRFSNFEADYDGNFGRRPSFRPVKFPKFPRFPRPRPPSFLHDQFQYFGSGSGGQRIGVGYTQSPVGYLANLLRLLSYLVSRSP